MPNVEPICSQWFFLLGHFAKLIADIGCLISVLSPLGLPCLQVILAIRFTNCCWELLSIYYILCVGSLEFMLASVRQVNELQQISPACGLLGGIYLFIYRALPLPV